MRDWAASGVLALTGHRDGPPLLPPGHAATTARRLASWIADATCGTVQVDGGALLAERAALTGHQRQGATSLGGSCRLLPTADGWAAVSCARPGDPLLLGALVGETLGEDPWPTVAAWLRITAGAELAERAELLGVPAAPVHPRAAAPLWPARPRPVAGLLVVDFSALWAGPLCAHLLGLAGARVVTVETPQRPDGARRGNPDFYRLLHGGHASVVLDPATAGGRQSLQTLVRRADIVIESSRPRALARFGLSATEHVSGGGTWVSITAAGRASDRVGFGDDVAASSGLVAHDAAGLPVFVGDALADPLTGLTAAALAMSDPLGGGGALWDVSMADVVAATLSGPAPEGRVARGEHGWVVRGEEDVPVALPRARPPRGLAPTSGASTNEVLRGLGIAAP
ncbi:CoA transferase [Rhodococcus sp. X156]|uniref:CoA transferase n=1 Tax=Rhodococcus sp. X156 TaxID=2499145 RepID=UPI000FDB659D|nr:CoA transferase [Rhodococcus sp. X156]